MQSASTRRMGRILNKVGDRTGGIDMNRTGDIYMNRIALAVKSALGIAMLVPPGVVLAAAPDENALQEIVVTGIRRPPHFSIEAKHHSPTHTQAATPHNNSQMP